MRFGPAGNAERFYAEGFKASVQAPEWLAAQGLTAYEYSFGRGVSLSDDTAAAIRAQTEKWGIAVSVHAPYYINLANPDPEKREASFCYILDSARKAAALGGRRVVVHVGAAMKMERSEALANCRAGLIEAYRRLDDIGLEQTILCLPRFSLCIRRDHHRRKTFHGRASRRPSPQQWIPPIPRSHPRNHRQNRTFTRRHSKNVR